MYKRQTVDYAKTRPVFDGYKAARYSKKYLAEHEAELATYRAAKDTMNTILNGAKLPKTEALKKSRRELAEQKKELYAEYREAVTVKFRKGWDDEHVNAVEFARIMEESGAAALTVHVQSFSGVF